MVDDVVGTTAPRIGIVDRGDRLGASVRRALDTIGPVVAREPDEPADWRDDVLLWAAAPEDDAMLDAACAAAGRLVLVLPLAQVDAWGDAVGRAGVDIVIEDDPESIVRAVARRRLRHAPSPLREPNGDTGDAANRLRDLSIEVGRIAEALGTLGREGGVADRRPGYRAAPAAGRPPTASDVRAMIRARRLRDQFFAPELFADPAWDILLDLTAARLEGRDVAVSSLCIAAAVPPTTALRWIGMMTEAGMLVRHADPDDRRRVFIRLSDETAERMQTCLGALAVTGAPVA